MIVYGSSISPFVRKVLAFAQEKGVAVELVAAGMGRGGPAFEEASPFGKMPGFRDPGADDGRDFRISDSTAIVTYIDAKHPEPTLIPTDPIGRARTIWYDEFADTILFGMAVKLFFNRFVAPKVLKIAGNEAIAAAAERDELPPVLDYLESVVRPSGFLVEDRFTLADIAVASPFVNLSHISVDLGRWPKTVAYVDAILARPSFSGLVAAERALIAKMTA